MNIEPGQVWRKRWCYRTVIDVYLDELSEDDPHGSFQEWWVIYRTTVGFTKTIQLYKFETWAEGAKLEK